MFLKITLLNSILVLTVYPPATTFFHPYTSLFLYTLFIELVKDFYMCALHIIAFCSKR